TGGRRGRSLRRSGAAQRGIPPSKRSRPRCSAKPERTDLLGPAERAEPVFQRRKKLRGLAVAVGRARGDRPGSIWPPTQWRSVRPTIDSRPGVDVMRGLAPMVRDLAVRTPDSRERSADMWRALAICLVVLGHWFVIAVTHRDGVLSGYNALDVLTWVDPV